MKSLLFSLFLIANIAAFGQYKNVDAATFKSYIKETSNVLIDLRTQDEIDRKGQIPGSLHIDYFGKDAETKIGELDRKKTYLVYCAGGGRSTECADMMQKKGFKSVINLEKGYDDWKKKGYETTGGQKK